MWWNHGDLAWGDWLFMAASMLAFWGLIAWAIIALTRTGGERNPHPEPTPEQILATRLANGEIDESGYSRALATLRGDSTEPAIREHTSSPR